MRSLLAAHNAVFERAERLLGPWFLPTLARIVFAGVLLNYFWNSARTKVGEGFLGFLSPADSAYFQIFPKAIEAADYDPGKLSLFHTLVALAGTWAEFVLPFLIIVGLFTRLAALGMAGFIVVQSIVDVTGHGVAGKDLGAWFDAASGALILDQRALWLLLLAILVVRGAGRISLDRLVKNR